MSINTDIGRWPRSDEGAYNVSMSSEEKEAAAKRLMAADDEDISDEDYTVWKRDRVTKAVARSIEEQVPLLRTLMEGNYKDHIQVVKLKGKIEAYEEVLNWLEGDN
jgi:hypothetical protein